MINVLVFAAATCLSCRDAEPPTGLRLGVPDPVIDFQEAEGCVKFELTLVAGSVPTSQSVYTPNWPCPSGELRVLTDTAIVFDSTTGALRVGVVLENVGTVPIIGPVRLSDFPNAIERYDAQGAWVSAAGLPPILGYHADSTGAGGRSWWTFSNILAAPGQPQVLMPGARTLRRWVEFRGNSWAYRTQLKVWALGREYVGVVPALPPDSAPAFINDSTFVVRSPNGRYAYVRDLVVVTFRQSASQAQKDSALESVMGVVVGGARSSAEGGGLFYIRIPADSTRAGIDSAVATLRLHPAVLNAGPYGILFLDPTRAFPSAGSGWNRSTWRAGPTSTGIGGNWGLMPGRFPLAWGPANIEAYPNSEMSFVRDVLMIVFRNGATQAQKDAALQSVMGTVIGGTPYPGIQGGGFYYIKVPRTTAAGLDSLASMLRALPFVYTASPYVFVAFGQRYALAHDGADWTNGSSRAGTTAAMGRATPGFIRTRFAFPQVALRGAFGRIAFRAHDDVVGPLAEPFQWNRLDDESRAYRTRLRVLALATERDTTVPAVAPDTTPRSFIDSLPTLTLLPNMIVKAQLIWVEFKQGVSQSARQAFVEQFGGHVIGGRSARRAGAEGVYLIHIPQAATGSDLVRAAFQANDNDVVAFADLLQLNRPDDASWAYRTRLRVLALAKERDTTVPAVAPDTTPRSFIDSLPTLTLLPNMIVKAQLLWVEFKQGVSQSARQAFVKQFGGNVIGGRKSRLSGNEGAYLIHLPQATTGSAVLRAAFQARENESVALVDLVQLNRPDDASWAYRTRLRVLALAKERDTTVPAVAPDTTPRSFIDSLPTLTLLPNMVVKAQLIWVEFKQGVSQSARQAFVEQLGGNVIGGRKSPLSGNEGVYLIHLPGATTGSAVVRAVFLADENNNVAFAELVQLNRPDDASWVKPMDGANWSSGPI